MKHTEKATNDTLAAQVIAQLAERMHRDAERAEWALKLAPSRRTVVRLSFLQRLARVAA